MWLLAASKSAVSLVEHIFLAGPGDHCNNLSSKLLLHKESDVTRLVPVELLSLLFTPMVKVTLLRLSGE